MREKSMALVIVLLIILNGCSRGIPANEEIENQPKEDMSEPYSVASDTLTETEEPLESYTVPSITETEEPFDPYIMPTIEEQVLWEIDGLKLTALSIEKTGSLGINFTLNIRAENTSGAEIDVSVDQYIINDYMMDVGYSAVGQTDFEIEEDETVEEPIDIFFQDLSDAGIDKMGRIGRMELYLTAEYDDGRVYHSDCLTIETSSVEHMLISDEVPFENEFKRYNEVLYQSDDIQVTVSRLVDENQFWGPSLLFYIENNTEKNIKVELNELYLDNKQIEGRYSNAFNSDVYAGKKMVYRYWANDALDTINVMNFQLLKGSICIKDEYGQPIIEDVSVNFSVVHSTN